MFAGRWKSPTVAKRYVVEGGAMKRKYADHIGLDMAIITPQKNIPTPTGDFPQKKQ